MRVLLTGMTAQQTNPINHDRSPNFPGLLRDAMTHDKHEVSWCEPSVEWTDEVIDEYDVIIVGVAPLTAIGANRAYGALALIERHWEDPRLTLLVDAPDPLKMLSASASMLKHPETLTKDFYRLRKEYRLVVEDEPLQKRLIQGARRLNYWTWPRTLVPHLPWQSVVQLEKQLPQAQGHVLPMNLDLLLINRFENKGHKTSDTFWSYEPGSHPTWASKNPVTWPKQELPKSHRREMITDTLRVLGRSAGCLICPSKTGTWWSPRYAMSLSQGTPVFSDWHETQFLSSAWTHLPSSFELMDSDERAEVARLQHESYVKALPHYLPEI